MEWLVLYPLLQVSNRFRSSCLFVLYVWAHTSIIEIKYVHGKRIILPALEDETTWLCDPPQTLAQNPCCVSASPSVSACGWGEYRSSYWQDLDVPGFSLLPSLCPPYSCAFPEAVGPHSLHWTNTMMGEWGTQKRIRSLSLPSPTAEICKQVIKT